jgi:hypothetical protein
VKTVNEIIAYVRLLPHAERERIINLLNMIFRAEKEEEAND